MSQETAKYVLWALMCIPVVALGTYFIFRLADDVLSISRSRAARLKAARERKLKAADELRRREIFDENYLEHQYNRYMDNDHR